MDWRKIAYEELHDLYSLSSITPLIKSIRSVFFAKYYSADEVNRNGTCGACDTYAGDERCMQGFGGEIWKS